MRPHLLSCLVASTLLIGSAPAWAHGENEHGGHAAPVTAHAMAPTAFGQAGDAAKVTRTVRIEMTDAMRFTPAKLNVKPGETVRFVLHNDGQILHEMVLGDAAALKQHAAMMLKDPEMAHGDPSMVHVQPGATGELVWQFTKAGSFEFACLQPGHFEAGMVGQVEVR